MNIGEIVNKKMLCLFFASLMSCTLPGANTSISTEDKSPSICADAQKPRFAPVPVLIFFEDELSEKLDKSFKNAVNSWNDSLSAQLFAFANQSGTEQVCYSIYVTTVNVAPEDEEQHFWGISSVNKCALRMQLNVNATEREIMHELGHAMGLEHEPEKWSVMHDPPGEYITEYSMCIVNKILY